MRQEEEVFGRLLAFAERDARVRVVLLNGSRVNPNVAKDELRDYDVIYGVTDFASFAEDQSWIAAEFGELMIMQHNQAEEDGEAWEIFLMLFTDGVRIDLSFRRADTVAGIEDSLTKVLLDKDGRMGEIPPPSERSYVTAKPDKREVEKAFNEIWWCSTNVAKGLVRGEIPYAKFMLDAVVRDAVVKLLSWHVGMNNGWTVNVGKAGRWLERFLPEELWTSYARTYADGDPERIWDALFETGRLTRAVGLAVADKLGCAYPLEEDRKVTEYMRQLRERE
ncbi:aminoglycoside 6-adenylyltransferase [Cohnella sp.]|uniref:aminoglycoside 6-adenylyltransferase n=1 Tax=Cohnella sp. TaxID=1883426 RepID=UPI0035636EE8